MTFTPRKFLLSLYIVIRILLWAVLVVILYNVTLDLSLTVREYVFENYCPSQERYHFGTWHPVTEYYNRVDWCDTSWWHTFRLLTRIYYGFIAGVLVSITASIIIPNGLTNRIAAGFIVFVCVINALWIAFEPMKNYTYRSCLLHLYEQEKDWDKSGKYKILTKEDCEIQLGPYGDQRLYFPLATLATFVIARRRVRSSLKSISIIAVEKVK
jgi:hypothetical protein